jgi:transposase
LDKGKVEVGVQVAQRWILARLRNRTSFSLEALNTAIGELLEDLNQRPMRQLGASRRELFERLDQPALQSPPVQRYELARWKLCRPNIDYHVEIERHLYSVPFQLRDQKLEARYTASVVEIYFRNQRVTSHRRRYDHQPSTRAEHMPSSHRAHAEWTPSRLIRWAQKTGPATGRLVAGILDRRPHPEQGYRACLGLMRLGRQHGEARLEAASTRALALESYSYRTVRNILASAQDRLPLESAESEPTPHHANIRGGDYYTHHPEEDQTRAD